MRASPTENRAAWIALAALAVGGLLLAGCAAGIFLSVDQGFVLKREIDPIDVAKIIGGLVVLFFVQQALEKRRGAARYERDHIAERLKQCVALLQEIAAKVEECREENLVALATWYFFVRTFKTVRMQIDSSSRLVRECGMELADEFAKCDAAISSYQSLLTGIPPDSPFPSEWKGSSATSYLRAVEGVDVLILRANRA